VEALQRHRLPNLRGTLLKSADAYH